MCVGCFLYTNLSGEVLDIPAPEVTFAKRNVDDVQVKRFFRSLPVKFKAGPQNTFEPACVAVNTVHDFSSSFPVRQTMSVL